MICLFYKYAERGKKYPSFVVDGFSRSTMELKTSHVEMQTFHCLQFTVTDFWAIQNKVIN